jgi:hypothetical protein
MPLHLDWLPHRFPAAGFEAAFPCMPTHEVTAPASRPDWDLRQHRVTAHVPGCDICVDIQLIKWRSIPPEDQETSGASLAFGELPPWEKRAAAAALEQFLAEHGHPIPRRLSGGELESAQFLATHGRPLPRPSGGAWDGEVSYQSPTGLVTARFIWNCETPFNGGSRWTVAAISGDAAAVDHFFRGFNACPSEWLQEEWHKFLADNKGNSG